MEYFPEEDFLSLWVTTSISKGMGQFKPQELATSIHGLGRLEYFPGKEYMDK